MNPLFSFDLLGLTITDTVIVSFALTLVLSLVAIGTSRALHPTQFGVWQITVEAYVGWIRELVGGIVEEDPDPYTPLIGTLILFVGACNMLSLIPVVRPPTADLSTTVALSLVVFLAVPSYGIWRRGVWGYLSGYLRPHPLMLPFNLISELTRTLALAVRLFGNVMSAQMVGAVMLVVAGVLVPIPLLLLGIITGLIQAYIFGVLAAVFIAAAVQIEDTKSPNAQAAS
ncbi:ATP synthase F0 sector subunit a [Enhygromyxa salina]|uniref:ATP synthase subunit a n=1 Tax=Enhygromyxa salina TaxID=215803 RepID=A0A0C2A0D0_9BACT|nr:F0F1 ATP synthase subunit A [Enhygromyxa salina]KIG16823.1 ATP synthase F0 sector subunit a [Enhygromyxa salina]